ncbi:MAG: STAS domain-containing protein [Chloroflexi bacterium]|nr:STAS domain-containing protein [Chloroflexota bacterium]
MEITTALEQGRVPVTVVQVSGNLDSSSFQAFQTGVEDLIASGARHILVDLTNAPFLSSAGLRALQSIFTRLRTENQDISEEEMHKGISAGTYKSPHLKILNLSEQAGTAFKMAGFDMFIETFIDRQAAISSF